MEAEYIALCEASKEAVWLNKLVQSVASQGLRTAISGGPINTKVDNRGCIDSSKNFVEHKRTKHIDIRYHFVREAITTDKVTLQHCATDDMVATNVGDTIAVSRIISRRCRISRLTVVICRSLIGPFSRQTNSVRAIWWRFRLDRHWSILF